VLTRGREKESKRRGNRGKGRGTRAAVGIKEGTETKKKGENRSVLNIDDPTRARSELCREKSAQAIESS
jgi:hypothetical protein